MGIIVPHVSPVMFNRGGLLNNHTFLENVIGIFLLIILCSILSTITSYHIEEIKKEKKDDRYKLIIKSFVNFFLIYTGVVIFFGLFYLIINRFL